MLYNEDFRTTDFIAIYYFWTIKGNLPDQRLAALSAKSISIHISFNQFDFLIIRN